VDPGIPPGTDGQSISGRFQIMAESDFTVFYDFR
jgi:hypothetical protein